MAFHPLDPLAGAEFSAASAILAREHGVGDGWRFASIELVEPPKGAVRAFEADGTVPDRRARLVVLNRAENSTWVAVVSLTACTKPSGPPIGATKNTLADSADLLLIAPATANVLAKLAAGIADDALTCIALALNPPA